MSMGGRYRAGVIGLGRIGFAFGYDKLREQPASHARALAENPRVVLAGGCDSDPARLSDFKARYPSAKAFDKVSRFLSDGPWDMVVVAVREESHLSVMREVCAARPRLVILEKPVAPNMRDARELQKIADDAGVPVCVNHERRFSRDYRWLKEKAALGAAGDLLAVNGALLTSSKAWYHEDAVLGRGCLVHDVTHMLDVITCITGHPIDVSHVSHTGRGPGGDIDGISFLGKAGAASVSILCGYRAEPLVFELEFIFRKARARIGNGVLEWWESAKSPYYEGFHSLIRDRRVKPFQKTGYFSGMVRNCVGFLDGDEPLLSPLSQAMEAVRATDDVIRRLPDSDQ